MVTWWRATSSTSLDAIVKIVKIGTLPRHLKHQISLVILFDAANENSEITSFRQDRQYRFCAQVYQQCDMVMRRNNGEIRVHQSR